MIHLKLAVLAAACGLGAVYAQTTSAQPRPATPKWEVTTVKPCAPGSRPSRAAATPGRLVVACMSVMGLINGSYVLYADGTLHLPGARLVPIENGPEWIRSDSYSIEAKAEGSPSQAPPSQTMMLGPMLQALLKERFKLQIHSEFRDVPAYVLTVGKGGPKLQPAQEGGCRPIGLATSPVPPPQPPLPPCRVALFTKGEFRVLGVTMAEFGAALSSRLDREVIDRTGLAGKFDIRVALPGVSETLGLSAPGPPPGGGIGPGAPPNPQDPAAFLDAAQTVAQKVGLKLEAGKGPGRFLVIDHVERPSPN